jgi:hypothetical protein
VQIGGSPVDAPKRTSKLVCCKHPNTVAIETNRSARKPHDLPHPVPPGSQKDDPLEISKPVDHTKLDTPYSNEDSSGLIHPLHSFVLS